MGVVRNFVRDESGATAVEFALVLPLLLSIVFGIVCFGQYFAIANSLQQLTAEAARASITEIDPAARPGKAKSFVKSAGARFAALDSDRIDPDAVPISSPAEGIEVSATYDLTGSAVEIASDFLGLNIETITRSSYLAY